MKPRGIVAELATLFLGVLAAAWLLGVPRDFVGSPDANEYAEFCNAILDGRLFTRQGDEVSRALATRTPGYPLALAALTAFGLGSRNVLSVLHAGVALLTLLSVPLLLRRFAPVGLCAAGVLVAFLGMKSYYERPVTEWLALNLLLMSFALVVRYCERPVAMRLVAVGLAVSACVLTRPALIPTVLVPLGLACLSPGRARIMLLVALASLAPVLGWMGFNRWRLGSFTLTPFAGANLFAIAALAGHATPRDGDDHEIVRFIEAINAGKDPPPGERFDGRKIVETFNANIHELAEPLAKERGYDQVTFDRMLLTYARRSIAAHPGAYAALVARGLRVPLLDLALLSLAVVVIPLVWLRRGARRGFAVAALAFAGLHLAHLSICASMELVIPRYRWLTLTPLLGIALVTSGLFVAPTIGSAWRRRSGRPASPTSAGTDVPNA